MPRLTDDFSLEWANFRQSTVLGSWTTELTQGAVTVRASQSPSGEEPNGPEMASWEALRPALDGRAEVDALVRVRCTSFPLGATILDPGVALFARLPTGSFTPSVGLAHMLRRHGTQLRLFYGAFDPLNSPPAGSTHNFASGMVVGAWYWMRLQVTRDSTTEYVKGKMWADGDPEPDWQVQRSEAISSQHTPALGGTIGVANSGGGGTSLSPPPGYTWNYAAELFSDSPPERPPLDAPVTVHLGETLNGVFADPSVDVTFFQNVDLEVGSVNTIGDQLSSEAWYRFAIRDRSKSRGLVAYTGETLLTRLSRMRPRESLILVAGDGGVPNPLTLQECLRRFLTFYGVPFKEPLPPFFLRTSTGIVTPTAQAFVIQPDQENPESVFDWLELFFGPFRGYTWRADADDELVIKPPAWAEATGLRFHLYRSSPVQQRTDLTYPWPWPGRAPTVEYRLTVEGETVTGTIGPLEAGVAEELIEGVLEFELTWAGGGTTLQVERTAPFGFAPVFDAVFIAKPAADDVEGELELTVDDLTPDETETSTADSVYTQAIIPVRERTFQADQPLMQPAAIVLKSPEQLAAGAFGANVPFGPMEWAPESPEGFLELVNDDAQAGTWFWPVDPEAVPQPGGAVTVEYEVEEWAEQWRGNLASAHEAAYQANTYSDSVTVDTNGVEVKVLDFEFPAQTSGFPGSFTARGSLYARWRSGDEPGIELTVRNGRFVEWGFLWEGIGGQTVYFLWGVMVKLNGTGVVWTVGDLQVARFGFSRNADGTWEEGANVPGLAEAQRLFPNRVFHSPELPYQVDPATALSIARAVVEENHVPKVVYQLPLAPAREQGWAYHPRHLGGAVDVPALGVKGRVTAHDYTESHSPGGSSSALVVDVEVAQAMPNTPAAPTGRKFGRAVYGVTTYQPTEEE